MTKKAWIVIALILVIPLVFTAVQVSDFRKKNAVVAQYGEMLTEISYGKLTLYEVPNNGTYLAEPGVFLGKIGDSLLGAGLYTVKYDRTGDIFAAVTEKGTLLYTETGKLPAEAYRGQKVTRVFFDSFMHPIENPDRILLMTDLAEVGSSAVLYSPDQNRKTEEHEVHLCYDGCAVSTVSAGRLIRFADTGRWFFLSESSRAEGDAAAEAGLTERPEYRLRPVTDGETLRLLRSLFGPEGEEDSTAETRD